MVNRIALVLLAAGCARSPTGVLGQWVVTLTCEEGADVASFPDCDAPSRVFLDLVQDAPPAGDHLSLFPGHTRADGAYVGMSGQVSGAWTAATLLLTLHGDLDHPLASDGDLSAWTDRSLRLDGVPSSRCWDASWAFEGVDGTIAVAGDASVSRLDHGCPSLDP